MLEYWDIDSVRDVVSEWGRGVWTVGFSKVGKDRVGKYSVAVIQLVVGVVFTVNVKSFYRVEIRALLMVT